MTKRFLISIAAMFAAVASPQFVSAQTANPESAVPPRIAVDDFVDAGFLRGPMLSPDGEQMMFRETLNKKTFIGIKRLEASKINHIAVPEKNHLKWYRWAGPNQALISISSTGFLDGELVPVSNLIRYDLQKNEMVRLGRKTQGIIGDDVLYVDPDGVYILLALQKTIYDYPGVFRVELADNSLTEIVKPQSNIWQWIADDRGIVRMGISYAGRTTKIYYRRANDAKFELISKIKDNADEESQKNDLLEVVRVVSGKDDGYVLSNKETGRFALYKFNYLTREIGEKVFDHAENDLTSFWLNDDGSALEAVTYTDDRDRIVWFDETYKKRQRSLEKALPGQEVWLQSRSRDGNRTIVYTTSPTDPGSYFLYDAAAKRLDRFAGLNEKLDPAQLSVTKYVRYPARDGLTIPAYLTLPVGRKPSKLPLIILPHGGPFGVRDTLDFSMEVQFLANRGYAVLQPNFRGTSSYGEEYYKRGEGQIGRAMQDDLDDGMDWLVKEGTVDPARVCIVGSSYGGYAAIWGIIRNPERYRCAASFAGVTDWKPQLRFDRKYLESRYHREWQNQVRGEKEFDLDSVSPVKLAAKLDRPLLLTHGDEDSNVPFSQYKSMVEALKKVGKSVETHVYEGEGHGFNNPDNEKDWLTRLETFLAKHNPADGTGATPPSPAPTAPK